jgi:aminoglycoside phosphotransferase (APT) family kinase protein
MDDPWSVVAEPRRAAVRDAVVAAFGRAAVEAVRPLTGGNSATNFRIDVAGRPYALRLEAENGGIRDPERTYPCLEAASAAGLSPAVRYLDPSGGVAIVDFHAPVPLADYPGGALGLAAELGRMVARLQSLAPFPTFGRFAELVRAVFGYVSGSRLFAPGLLDAHAEAFEALAAAYPWAAEPRVASHNDINHNNLLFDGVRLWLIDWETAFRNDPFLDVAVIAGETLLTISQDSSSRPDLEAALLGAWLGRAADQRARDRLALMKPLSRFYQVSLMLSGFADRPMPGTPVTDLAAMTRSEFRAARAQGRLADRSPELPIAYAKILLAEFWELCAAPETKAAMRRLASG